MSEIFRDLPGLRLIWGRDSNILEIRRAGGLRDGVSGISPLHKPQNGLHFIVRWNIRYESGTGVQYKVSVENVRQSLSSLGTPFRIIWFEWVKRNVLLTIYSIFAGMVSSVMGENSSAPLLISIKLSGRDSVFKP